MNADLFKQLLDAIVNEDREAVKKIAAIVVSEEKEKGNTAIVNEVESLVKRWTSKSKIKKARKVDPLAQFESEGIIVRVPQESLRHHLNFPTEAIEARLSKIEREYAGRNELAHHGLRCRQKILLCGLPGSGKTIAAERLAWDTGLRFVKIKFDVLVSSHPNAIAQTLREILEIVTKQRCLIFIDPIAPIVMQLLDQYDSINGLLVAATTLDELPSLTVRDRFDDVIHLSAPDENGIESILKQHLSGMTIGAVCWDFLTPKLKGFSADQIARIAKDAAKRSILERSQWVQQTHFEAALKYATFSER